MFVVSACRYLQFNSAGIRVVTSPANLLPFSLPCPQWLPLFVVVVVALFVAPIASTINEVKLRESEWHCSADCF